MVVISMGTYTNPEAFLYVQLGNTYLMSRPELTPYGLPHSTISLH